MWTTIPMEYFLCGLLYLWITVRRLQDVVIKIETKLEDRNVSLQLFFDKSYD